MLKSEKTPTRGSFAIGGATFQRLLEVAKEVNLSPNEIVNSLVRDCLVALDSPKKSSAGDIGFLLALRKTLRRDLSGSDKLTMGWLEKHFPNWAETTADYRRLLLRMAADVEELDAAKLKKLADEAWEKTKAAHKKQKQG